MNVLVVGCGPIHTGALFAHGLSNYCDVKTVGYGYPLPYNIDIYKEYMEKYQITNVYLDNFDCVVGIEQGCLPILSDMKKSYPNKLYICQILDYPKHVFQKTKDYHSVVKKRWEDIYTQYIGDIDIFLCNQENSINDVKTMANNSKVHFIRYPVFPIKFEDYDRKDFIVYSGRLHPDKGVHYILDALSVIEEDIELVTVGSGFDFTEYAKYLKVRYRNIANCSEHDKWKIYHESRFVVCGADNPYIPALCILEGISIGRCGVVFDSKENRLHYREFAWYNVPRSIDGLANCIKFMFNDMNLSDEKAAGGPLFVEEECTYDAWGKKVFNIIKESK